jgi:hypothetical protein
LSATTVIAVRAVRAWRLSPRVVAAQRTVKVAGPAAALDGTVHENATVAALAFTMRVRIVLPTRDACNRQRACLRVANSTNACALRWTSCVAPVIRTGGAWRAAAVEAISRLAMPTLASTAPGSRRPRESRPRRGKGTAVGVDLLMAFTLSRDDKVRRVLTARLAAKPPSGVFEHRPYA